MTDPTVQQAISYYRKVADEATRSANNLEGLLSILEEETAFQESIAGCPTQKDWEHLITTKQSEVYVPSESSETVTVDDIKRMLGDGSARVPQIAYHFEMPEVDVEKLVTPKNGFKVSSNGWVKVA